jgi:hypothetical protein
MTEQRYRVIVWGVGSIGAEMVTAIIDHRHDLQLVGAKVYSAEKNGADVGELVGRPRLGVAATTDADTLIALDADCVIYTPRIGDLDEVCQHRHRDAGAQRRRRRDPGSPGFRRHLRPAADHQSHRIRALTRRLHFWCDT